MPRSSLLTLAIAAALLSSSARANDEADPTAPATAADQKEKTLHEVVVTASPLAQPGSELVKPSAVISGPELDDHRGSTIGETVNQIPGVQTSYFGAGVGRPIIRGMEGARVQVLEGGTSSLDLAGQSADHAVTIDPFLADQVEVLKGPSTLLYGTGAIGGVVNVVDGRVPEKAIDGVHGRVQLDGNSVDSGEGAVGRVDAGNGEFAFHADYSRHLADDYEIPGKGTLLNSDSSTRSDALGLGYTGADAFAGVAVSSLEYHYGIPVGPSRGPIDPDLEAVRIDMKQTRVDAKAGLIEPVSWLDKITFRIGHNDYQHIEHPAGETEGTLFKNNGYDARLEAVLSPIGPWRGAVGTQFGHRDFSAIGAETIVPNTSIRDTGVFVMEEADLAPFKLELGARYDKRNLDSDGFDKVDFNSTSLSAGAIWEFADSWHVALNLDRAQRAPEEEELFVHGAHDATGSFERGDAELTKETANQIELGLHYHAEDVQAMVGAYYNRFDDFIYLAATGEVDDEEGLPIRQWSQHDAHFRGAESELKFKLTENDWGRFDTRLFADTVRAEFTDGAGNVPRIAPGRVGASLLWKRDTWRASLGAIHYAKQDRVGDFETPTGGYTFVDAHLSYSFSAGPAEWELFVDGKNLSDQDARNATSFLKDRAPLPGRAFLFGVRSFF